MIKPNPIVGEGCKYGLVQFKKFGSEYGTPEPVYMTLQPHLSKVPADSEVENYEPGLSLSGNFYQLNAKAGADCSHMFVEVIGNIMESNETVLTPNPGTDYYLTDATEEERLKMNNNERFELEDRLFAEGTDFLTINFENTGTDMSKGSYVNLYIDDYEEIRVNYEGKTLNKAQILDLANENGHVSLGHHTIDLNFSDTDDD